MQSRSRLHLRQHAAANVDLQAGDIGLFGSSSLLRQRSSSSGVGCETAVLSLWIVVSLNPLVCDGRRCIVDSSACSVFPDCAPAFALAISSAVAGAPGSASDLAASVLGSASDAFLFANTSSMFVESELSLGLRLCGGFWNGFGSSFFLGKELIASSPGSSAIGVRGVLLPDEPRSLGPPWRRVLPAAK